MQRGNGGKDRAGYRHQNQSNTSRISSLYAHQDRGEETKETFWARHWVWFYFSVNKLIKQYGLDLLHRSIDWFIVWRRTWEREKQHSKSQTGFGENFVGNFNSPQNSHQSRCQAGFGGLVSNVNWLAMSWVVALVLYLAVLAKLPAR